MKKRNATRTRSVKANTGRDLAQLLELSEEEDSAAMELRVALVKKIIAEIGKQELTHAQIAERTGTSRSRMTSILNGLAALGVRARISFSKAA